MGIAITGLINSSLSITYLYINDIAENIIRDLSYHAIVFFSGNNHTWILEQKYSTRLNREEISQYINVYLESYVLNSGFYINDIHINGSITIVLMYYPGLKKNYAIISTPYKFENLSNIIYNNTLQNNEAKISIDKKIYINVSLIETNYIEKVLDNAFLRMNPSTITSEQFYNPYLEIYNIVHQNYGFPGPTHSPRLIILVSSKQSYINIANYIDKNYKPESISIASEKIIITPFLFSINTHVYSVSSGKILFSIIWFNPQKVIYGLSIDASINRINNVLKDITSSTKDLCDVHANKIVYRLYYAKQTEQLVRFTSIVSLLPSFVIIWLTTTKIPPVLVSIMRKTIALLRIRGVSIKKIRNNLLLAMIIWVFIGGIAGIPIGPFLAEVLYTGEYNQIIYFNLLSSILDPLIVVLSIAVTLTLMLISLRSTFKILSQIQPSEFTRPSIFARLPLIERGISRGTALLLILSIYYILRVLGIINPVKILSETNPGPLTIIIGILMLMLEPMMSLFGPVILIYSIAKLLISYPDKLGFIVSRIAGFVTKEYRALVSRLVMVKPARIALLIVLGTFSTGIILAGMVGINSTYTMYEHIGISMHGGLDYVVYKPVVFTSIDEIYDDLKQVGTAVNGTYTYALFLLGANTSKYNYISSRFFDEKGNMVNVYKVFNLSYNSADINIWIMFLPSNFSDVVEINDALGYGFNFENAIKQISSDHNKTIFVINIEALQVYSMPSSITKPFSGEARVKIEDNLFANIDVIGTSRNIPVVGYLSHPTDISNQLFAKNIISFGSLAQIELIYPIKPGLIMNILSLEEFLENNDLNDTGLAGYLFILVKGTINKSRIDEGYVVLDTESSHKSIDMVKQYMIMNFNSNLAMGISLFIIALIVVSLLSYSIIYENLYTYTLMRGRGIPNRSVYKLCMAEAISISLISVLPGIIIGLFLGYGLFNISQQYSAYMGTITVHQIYGVTFMLNFDTNFMLGVLIVFLLPVILSYIIVRSIYKKVVREAIMLLGSHI